MIEPEDVVALLKQLDFAEQLTLPLGLPALVRRDHLRELIVVWLRVAQLHELIEMNPGDYTAAELEHARALLFGVTPEPPDTEPQNEKPEPPAVIFCCPVTQKECDRPCVGAVCLRVLQ